jgi:hypothetical protein
MNKPVAWAWQDKAALRKIREKCENYGTALAVYTTLTVAASDAQSDTFTATHARLAQLSGFDARTVRRRLQDLQGIGLIEITTPRLKAPCAYKLCRPVMVSQRTVTKSERSDNERPVQSPTSEESKESEKKTLASPRRKTLRELFEEEEEKRFAANENRRD